MQIENRNPSDTSDLIGMYAQADAYQLDANLAAAHRAQPIWWAGSIQKCHDMLMAVGTELMARAEEIGHMLSREEGKPVSAYPDHMKDGSKCKLQSWCNMAALVVDLVVPQSVSIGTDMCQDQSDSTVEWMRVGRWTKGIDYDEGIASNASFSAMPDWLHDNRDLAGIREGLLAVGLNLALTDGAMGDNWHAFFDKKLGHKPPSQTPKTLPIRLRIIASWRNKDE